LSLFFGLAKSANLLAVLCRGSCVLKTSRLLFVGEPLGPCICPEPCLPYLSPWPGVPGLSTGH
jgi:hypothetical protein